MKGKTRIKLIIYILKVPTLIFLKFKTYSSKINIIPSFFCTFTIG